MKQALAAVFYWGVKAPLVVGPQAFWRFVWPGVTFMRLQSWVYLPAGLFCLSLLVLRHFGLPGGVDLVATIPALAWPWWSRALAVWVCSPAWSAVLLAPIHVSMLSSPAQQARKTSHGSASWGTLRQARDSGLVQLENPNPGFILGRAKSYKKRAGDHRFRVRESHVITFSRTGGGKGIGCVIPNLLLWPGSAFVLDVKGTSYAITAEARKRAGHAVACIDPFGITERPTHRVNWIAGLDLTSREVVNEAARIADTLVVRAAGEDSHWDDSAAALLQGLILHVASLPVEDAHPGTLRHILTLPHADLLIPLKAMSESSAAFGLVARTANAFLGKADRERSGVLSTAQRHTQFLDDPMVVDACRKTDFDFRDMKRRSLTVYLIIPFELLHPYSRFVRVLMGGALQALMKERTIPKHDVLFMLDEFARLGRFDLMEGMLPMLRDYRVRVWALFQDLAQLKANYPRLWASYLANAVTQFFGVQDWETCQYLSKALGNATLRVETSSRGSSAGQKHESQSSSRNEQFVGRPLLTPDEVRRMPGDQVVVLVPSQPPYKLERMNYLRDPETAGMAKPDPMHATAVAPESNESDVRATRRAS